MPTEQNISGDVAAAASALAGLLLVFLGSAVSSYLSYEKQAQNAVRTKYQRMGWLSFVGFVTSILAAFLALLGSWLGYACMMTSALFVLFSSFIFVLLAALFAVLEIK